MPFEPVNEAHAIEKVSTTFTLQNPISGANWPDVLQAAINTARDSEFPRYGEAAAIQLQVGPAADDPSTVEASLRSRHGGVSFRQGESPPAPVQREFVVTRTELRVDTYVYVRWSGYRAVIEEILRGLGPTFFASGSADATQLEYTDLFVHPG